MDEFVSERTSAYVSQHDLHIPELTVRETLAFAARCQGVGPRYGTSVKTPIYNLGWKNFILRIRIKLIFHLHFGKFRNVARIIEEREGCKYYARS
jgi:hypothetical protein